MKEKIKACLKKFFSNGRSVLVVLFILEIALSLFITPNTYDDKWFMEQITNEINPETNEVIEHTIKDFVADRYNTWSSRVLIEFVLCLVLKISKYAWILIEALMVTIVGYSISKLFINKNSKENNLILISMILIYPYNIMHQTGWASTTVNYMWPLAMCLFALIPIKKIWNNEKIKWFEYPFYTLALIFAGNQEQSSALLVAFYVLFLIINTIKHKKINLFMLVQTIISILSIIFILTCPGNAVRSEEELYRFIDYGMLSFLDKFILGFTSTFGQIIATRDIVFTMFATMLVVFVFTNYKDKLYRVIAVVPLASMLILGYLSTITFDIFPYLEVFYNSLITKDVLLTVANCNNFYFTFPIIFTFVNIIAIVMSLSLLTKRYKDNIALLIFLAGFASRIIVAFSPTVFVSKTRTMIFLDFAMIIISFIIWQMLKDKKENNKLISVTNVLIKSTAALQFLNVLVYIYSNQKLY